MTALYNKLGNSTREEIPCLGKPEVRLEVNELERGECGEVREDHREQGEGWEGVVDESFMTLLRKMERPDHALEMRRVS